MNILLTGASRGIGAAAYELLLSAGHDVVAPVGVLATHHVPPVDLGVVVVVLVELQRHGDPQVEEPLVVDLVNRDAALFRLRACRDHLRIRARTSWLRVRRAGSRSACRRCLLLTRRCSRWVLSESG